MAFMNRKYKYSFELDNVLISITTFGDFFYEQTSDSPTHLHTNYEMHFMSEGSSTLSTVNSSIQLNAQQACIIAPKVTHTWSTNNEKNIKCSFCFSFEKITKKQSSDTYEIFSNALCKVNEVQVLNNASKYLAEINKIINICSFDSAFKTKKLKLCFSYIMLEIADDLLNKFNLMYDESDLSVDIDQTEKNIRRTIIEDYVNRNYNKDLNLDSLSKILHLSQKQTERFFCQEMNTTFKQYVINVRLNAAVHYLKNTDLSVTEIASKIGYNSYNGFYRLFGREFNMTPQEYRAKYQG